MTRLTPDDIERFKGLVATLREHAEEEDHPDWQAALALSALLAERESVQSSAKLEGWEAGREAAAKWHDEKRADNLSVAAISNSSTHFAAMLSAEVHADSMLRIRALRPPPEIASPAAPAPARPSATGRREVSELQNLHLQSLHAEAAALKAQLVDAMAAVKSFGNHLGDIGVDFDRAYPEHVKMYMASLMQDAIKAARERARQGEGGS